MTIETDIQAVLDPLVGARVFPDDAPYGTPRPFICYEQAGGDALRYVDNTLPNKKHGRFEIGVYADTPAQRSALALQVEEVISAAAAFQATAIHAPIHDYANDVKIYSSIQNFSVFSNR